MKRIYPLVLALLADPVFLYGQPVKKLRVLFLGNSYTYVNNLPQMLADMAASVGDTVEFDSNAPGGHTLQGHSTNATSLAKIAQGNWHYVVLQEQSQLPSFPDPQVSAQVYPYARKLDSLIRVSSPCAETVFYMTWGRKNGDADNCGFWPPVCTYEGMDSLLRLRYMYMAEQNEGIVSPVGAVWRYLRQNHPTVNLYSADNSHPDVPGTYAAALSFYTVLFHKDPTAVTYTGSLDAGTAATIKNAVKTVVYAQLPQWFVGTYGPVADFSYTATDGYVNFGNLSQRADSYTWDFGDGTGSTDAQPQHAYWSLGTFTVTLLASRCGYTDTITKNITISTLDIDESETPGDLSVWPNPANEILRVRMAVGAGPFGLRVVDARGRCVYQAGNIYTGEYTVDASSLKTGIYLLTVYGGNGTVSTRKWVKTE